jgi:hypothetical protein
MKRTLFITAILFAAVFTAIAQPQPTGALTIFSEDGDKFYLILNGERQNNVGQTNLRIEDLPQPYYSAKIIFEDKSLPEITKNNLMITDANGVFMDVTYKIKHDKNGMPKMSSFPFSFIPMRQGFVAPSNVYVMHYGAPAAVVVNETPVSGTVTHTTTNTTTTNTGGVGASVNVGGINMGVTINDPVMNGTMQTTTTHTTTTTNSGSNTTVVQSTPAPVGCVNAFPMAAGDFSSALATIKKQGFEDSKLSTAKQIAGANCLSTNQISDICHAFGFEESKLDFAKFAYDHCTEPRNYFKINNVFGFSSSVDDLNEYVQSRH